VYKGAPLIVDFSAIRDSELDFSSRNCFVQAYPPNRIIGSRLLLPITHIQQPKNQQSASYLPNLLDKKQPIKSRPLSYNL
jgi:hypothetical protein